MQRSHSYFILAWVCAVIGAFCVYFFYPSFFQEQLARVTGASIYLGYGLLLLVGALRGFTLIPSTYLIIVGLFFFEPLPLFILIMAGIIISSVSVFYFSEFLRLDTFFEGKHQKRIIQIKKALEKNEFLIITLWSAAPFLPSDLICYVCGTLRLDIKKFILGVFVGESVTVGAYIFFGEYILRYGHMMMNFFS